MGCALLTGAFEIADPRYSHITPWKTASGDSIVLA